MTIANRLLILLAAPLPALVGLGLFPFPRRQFSAVKASSRYLAESRVEALAPQGCHSWR